MKRWLVVAMVTAGAVMVLWDVFLIPGRTTWLQDVGLALSNLGLVIVIFAQDRELTRIRQALAMEKASAKYWRDAAQEKS